MENTVDLNELHKWGNIVHIDLVLNMWLLSLWFWGNGFNMILSYGMLVLSVIYGFFAFNKNSFLNKKTIGLLIKIDMKSVDWAIKKLRTDPSNKLARSLCPLSMQPRRHD